VNLDSHALLVLSIGPVIGYLMIQSGVFKQMLERKQNDRICPSCGRASQTCICAGA
jgi:hypothetical protein